MSRSPLKVRFGIVLLVAFYMAIPLLYTVMKKRHWSYVCTDYDIEEARLNIVDENFKNGSKFYNNS
jgi:hypothetical protein